MKSLMQLFVCGTAAGLIGLLGACENKPSTPPPAPNSGASAPKPAPAAAKHDDHDHAAGDKHDDHDHTATGGHDDHGPTTELGSVAIGPFSVKASRDGGVTAGGEVPVDLWITPGAGGSAKVTAVRAWIGAQDGKGSLKAKLELEKDNYHSHVETPKPLPAGSKLWIEIEDDKGGKSVGSFDLKA